MQPDGLDKEEVLRRTDLRALVSRDVALKKRGADHWGCCPFHAERSASFKVHRDNSFYHCFGCGAHGDAFGWVMARRGVEFVTALRILAEEAGMVVPADGRPARPLAPIAGPPRPSREALEEERAEQRALAIRIWREAEPGPGTLAEVYLRARGIAFSKRGREADGFAEHEQSLGPVIAGVASFPWPPSIRFHPALRHPWSGTEAPAMISAAQGPDGQIRGIHRTYLAAQGQGKARLDPAKAMMGQCFGGHCRLVPAAPEMVIGEGIETTLSVMLSTGIAGWAALSEGNLGAPLPPIVRRVIILADNDAANERAQANRQARLAKAEAEHRSRGLDVSTAWPPAGLDFNDVLLGKKGKAS